MAADAPVPPGALLPGQLVPALTWTTLKRDAAAGVITGLMAIPLSVGICIMSDYPIQVGLATVAVACCMSFLLYLVRPGNHVGVPGIAAGLAPVLAMGVQKFGMATMPFIIFLTSALQMLVWKFELERYILRAVPAFLIEGLLAGVGLKIAMKFVPATYMALPGVAAELSQFAVVAGSVVAFGTFIYLYGRFKDTSPGVPYIAVIAASIVFARFAPVPMLHFDRVDIKLALPLIDVTKVTPELALEMVAFAAMLALIDVIEQVMSNAAIEKIDPLGRRANSNNSLLVMWTANMTSSLFGGMTNLDGLAKSSTNRMAGAITKTSALFVAAVMGAVLLFPDVLGYLPEFSLAVLMIFTGWKMIAGVFHVAAHGRYELGLALVCSVLVFRLGIFEGLLICLAIHSFISMVMFRHEKVPFIKVCKKFIAVFRSAVHPHATNTLDVSVDEVSGGQVYRSVERRAVSRMDLDDFVNEWAAGINSRNVLSVVGTYDLKGLLWGTFAKDLRTGHAEIKRYFEGLFELDGLSVEFESKETRQYGDIYIRSGSYRFSYRSKGAMHAVPARYSFVCKREKTGWYIVEHHSSEFPS